MTCIPHRVPECLLCMNLLTSTKGSTMTNLETVAAQRDEMSTKLRAMAQQLEAANAEIARLRAGNGGALEAPLPVNDGDLLSVALIPATPEVASEPSIAEVSEPFVPAPADPIATTPPKAKRTGLFGKKS
jgi:hypothetical protein